MAPSKSAKARLDLVRRVAASLADLRRASGMTREQLAESLGTAPTNLAQMLAGKQNLTLETVERVAMALGYRTHLSFDEDPAGPRSPPPGGRYARTRKVKE